MSVKPPLMRGLSLFPGRSSHLAGQDPSVMKLSENERRTGIPTGGLAMRGGGRPFPDKTNKPGGADAPPTVFKEDKDMAFFNSAIGVLQTLVVALGAGLGVWGAINLLEGYGNDNPGANAHVR